MGAAMVACSRAMTRGSILLIGCLPALCSVLLIGYLPARNRARTAGRRHRVASRNGS